MMSFGFSGFDLMERLFPVLFVLGFGCVVAVFIRGIIEWNKNNHSPRLTVPARVVARRTSFSHHPGAGENAAPHTSTSYFVTFEFDSGDRQEFHLNGRDYGQLAEGDVGLLTFQGTRYLDFERR